MPVTIGGKEQPPYRPFSSKVKRAVGVGGSRKDVELPATAVARRSRGRDRQGLEAGQGLMTKYRSPSKR
jgi:hypothetical protein